MPTHSQTKRILDGPIRATLWQALVLAIAIACVANAQAIQKWKTKEGTLYFGDKPPPGSTKLGEEGTNEPAPETAPATENAPAPESAPATESAPRSAERDRFSNAASRERNDIEKRLNRDAERLADVREKIEQVERQPNVVEPWMEKGLGLANEKGDALKKLRSEQREIASSMLKSWEQYDALDQKVRKEFAGSSPDWWRKVSCSRCPSPSEVKSLAE